jgi:exonuclease III
VLSFKGAINVLIWNISGVNKSLKQKEVKKMVARLKVSIIFLVETRVQKLNIIKIRDNMLPGWEILHNCNDHWLGKIWICWDPGGFSINVVDVHEQVLTCKVNATDNRGSWMMSIVYGSNQGTDGRHLLQRLIILKIFVGSVPWLIAGDFNVIRSQQERWGNAALTGYETEFVECVRRVEVEDEDLAFTGCFHTWTNK